MIRIVMPNLHSIMNSIFRSILLAKCINPAPLYRHYNMASTLWSPHSLTYTSTHGILSCRCPSQLLIHPIPTPLHAVGCIDILRFVSSRAAPTSAEAVSLTALAKNELSFAHPPLSDQFTACGCRRPEKCVVWKKLLCMSNRQRSDQ